MSIIEQDKNAKKKKTNEVDKEESHDNPVKLNGIYLTIRAGVNAGLCIATYMAVVLYFGQYFAIMPFDSFTPSILLAGKYTILPILGLYQLHINNALIKEVV